MATEANEIHVWLADDDGFYVGEVDSMGGPDTLEDYRANLAAAHPNWKAIDKGSSTRTAAKTMLEVAGQRPAERPPTAEQVALQTKATRLGALRAKPWSQLTKTEQLEATDLAFQLGQTVPAITALT